MVKPRSSASCLPRWATKRSPGRETLGPAVGAVAAQLNRPLLPWQQQVADVGLELLPDGRPAYRDVIFTVPRQSGKTLLILSWEVQRALGFAQMLQEPQRIAYSAQSGKDAKEKLLEDQIPLLDPQKRLLGIKTFYRAAGSESVVWKNGSRLVLLAGTEASGHGKTLDLGVQDELFADVDSRRDQAMSPAMATRAHAQKVIASTMGTAESLALNTAVTRGRAAVEEGRTTGTAYFEWSADPSEDPGDPATWWRCMPALGRTISLDVVEHEYDTLPLDEFRRAFTNVPTTTDERVISQSAWDAVNDEDVEATAEVFAFDVNPERSHAGIVAVGAGPIVEVVDYRPGTAWLVERIVELHRTYGAPFAVARSGQGGSFIAELVRQRVKLVELTATDMPRASGAFFDQVIDRKTTVRHNADLDAAVAGAAKRPVGDSWTWDRKSSRFDISLLVAASVGSWAFEMAPATPPHIAGDVDQDAYDAALAQIEQEERDAEELLGLE